MYQVKIRSSAERDIKRLDEMWQRRIIKEILLLSSDPRPINSKKLVGTDLGWRLKVGDYRVVYEIDDKNKTVIIYRVKHRKEAYR